MTVFIVISILGIIAFLIYSKWKKFSKFKSDLMFALIVSGMSRREADDLYTRNLSLINKIHLDGGSMGDILSALGVNRFMYDGMQEAAKELGYKEFIEASSKNTRNSQQEKSALDSLIEIVYGANPPSRTAVLSDSIQIAFDDLLLGVIPLKAITGKANELFISGMPFSTYDLAFSTALHFFREHPNKQDLFMAQLSATMILGDAVLEGKLNRTIAETFQEYVYTAYHPNNQ
jgi:hypothetical protein